MKNLIFLIVIILFIGCEKETNTTVLQLHNNTTFTLSTITIASTNQTVIINNLYSKKDTSFIFENDSAIIYIKAKIKLGFIPKPVIINRNKINKIILP